MLKKYDIKIDGEFPVNAIYQFNPPLTANFRTVEGYKVYKEVMKEIVKRYDGIIHENGYSLLDEVNKLEDGVLYNDKEEIHNLIIWDENGKWVMDYNLDLRPEGNPFRRYKGRDYSTKGENGWDLIMPNFDSSEIFSSLYERKNLIRKILLQEALKPSQFRKYVKAFNRERYTNIFKSLGDKYEHDRSYYRIYIPLGKEEKSGPVSVVEKEVVDFLNQNGYQVLDYIKGIVKFGEAKNTTTIGKVLTRLKADDLMKKFVSDESRKALTSDAENLMVVISRHPYDIAGSDTDRNWTNCMTLGHAGSDRVEKLYLEREKLINRYKEMTNNSLDLPKNPQMDTPEMKIQNIILYRKISGLEGEIEGRKESGENTKYLIHDVKEGSLISYLIKKTDKNIENPIAVLNIKPYINDNNPDDFILISDNTMYGNGRPEFKKVVDSILDEINGPIGGYYCLKKGLYVDSQNERIRILKPEEKTFYLEKAKEFVNTITKGEEIPCYTKTMLKDVREGGYSNSTELKSFYPEFVKQKCYLYRDKKNHRILDLRINDAELKFRNASFEIFNPTWRTHGKDSNTIENITLFKWFKNPELPDDTNVKAPYKILKGVISKGKITNGKQTFYSGTGLFDNEPYLNKILYSKEFLDFLRQKFHLDPNTKINHIYDYGTLKSESVGSKHGFYITG